MVQTSMRPSVHTRSQFDMEHLVCTPDLGVALPPEGMPYPLLKERAEAACATIDLLLGAGLDPAGHHAERPASCHLGTDIPIGHQYESSVCMDSKRIPR